MNAEPTTVESRPDEPATSLVTPQQAMHLLEARRARNFATGVAIVAASAAVVVFTIGGDPIAQHIHITALLLCAGVMGTYAAVRRDPARYRPIDMVILASFGMIANVTGYYYWGVYSAYMAAVAASGYAFASSVSHRSGLIVLTAVAIGGNVALAIAQLAGWMQARGLAEPTVWATDSVKVVVMVLLQLVMLIAILGGVQTRKQMIRVLDEHSTALRELSRRDAQLAEAQQEVREARQPGDGRYTGQMLGRYKLGKLLGRGAMGDVYDALDGDAPCAVKVLAANLLDNSDALRRFQREARAIQAIDAPNIVKMIEVSPESAVPPFLAMERLHGRDLASLLKKQPVRELREVVDIVQAIATALDAAHAAGVIHRDLKPANIFAAQTGGDVTWKLLDFGVSKLTGDATMTGAQLVGTPGYMAPEQARGEPVAAAADVYALAIVAYRLLTGRPAVVPSEPHAMVHEVVYRMPPRPSELADVSLGVEDVLAIALAKRPADRFATAGEFGRALADAAAGRRPASIVQRADDILDRLPWGAWADRPDRRRRTRSDTVRG